MKQTKISPKSPTTLAEAKEMACKELGYPSLKYARDNNGAHGMESLITRAAELYAQGAAREAWDRACEKFISCEKHCGSTKPSMDLSICLNCGSGLTLNRNNNFKPEYETLKR